MEALIYLDTHVALWIYAGEIERLPALAQDAINTQELLVSPMVLLEVQYLVEIGRFKDSVDALRTGLERSLGLSVCSAPFDEVVRQSVGLQWTRDPFDRIIAGHAVWADAPLVTKDATIHTHYPHALWD